MTILLFSPLIVLTAHCLPYMGILFSRRTVMDLKKKKKKWGSYCLWVLRLQEPLMVRLAQKVNWG